MGSARRVAPLLFFSGLCALVYQIAWLREFRLIFGASTAASAAVLAIFIGGLGVGGVLLGRRADGHPSPLRLYARLEMLIALSAATTPALLWLARRVYVAAGGTLSLGLVAGTVARLLLAALVLAVPTWLMGGTLPAAARAVATEGDQGRRSLALLYGINTLGAVTGSFVATFFMLELFGTRQTLWLACLVNLLVAMTAGRLAQRLGAPASPAAGAGASAAQPVPATPPTPAAPAGFVLFSAGVVGLAFFLMELVWYRMLGPVLGGSVFTFGLILSVALLGIGAGGVSYSLLRSNRPATLHGFAYTCLFEAFFVMFPYALGDRVAILALVLRPLGGVALFWGQMLGWSLVCLLVVFPAAFVAGYQFPMLIALLGRGGHGIGRQIGLAYAWNTVGAIAGSLMGGFGLVPLLSAPGAWRAAALGLTALGIVAIVLAARRESRVLAGPIALAVAVILLARTEGPTAAWRHSGIGAGRAAANILTPNDLHDWINTQRHPILWDADGVESSVALAAIGPGLSFIVNGKADGNSLGDAPTTIMSGMIGALIHPAPHSAMVVGLGMGGTAGWLGSVPSIERVDVVELEPVVLDVARACSAVNRDVMHNPRVHISIGDAREALLVSKQRYDLIFSEPSNPYRAGIASLFTREYYEAARGRLNADGLFMQWVQAYEIDGRTVRTIYSTLNSVFPSVETWQVGVGDLLLVASARPMTYDVATLRARLEQEPYRKAVLVSWRATDLEAVLSYFVGSAALSRAVTIHDTGGLNTDDRNPVEFGFGRTVGRSGLFAIADLREVALALGADRPESLRGDVDWARVAEKRAAFHRKRAPVPILQKTLTPGEQAIAAMLTRYSEGDTQGALTAWRELGREAHTPTELLIVAEALAQSGDASAVPYIDRLRAYFPVEADGVLGILRSRQGAFDDAAVAFEKCFVGFRTDPWALTPLMIRVLDAAAEMGSQDRAAARRVYTALREPFAARAEDDVRKTALADLAVKIDAGGLCQEALGAFEPYVPWNRTWLESRRDCYAATGDPRAARAQADLVAFQRLAPTPFAISLGIPLARPQ